MTKEQRVDELLGASNLDLSGYKYRYFNWGNEMKRRHIRSMMRNHPSEFIKAYYDAWKRGEITPEQAVKELSHCSTLYMDPIILRDAGIELQSIYR